MPIRTVRCSRVLALAGLLALLAGCGREEPEPSLPQLSGPEKPAEGGLLVRVGERELGAAELEGAIPPEYRGLLTGVERRAFLDRWVDTELLYQGAEAMGLTEDPELQRRLLQQRRDFFANAYLRRVLDERVAVSESEVDEYFEAHRDDYAWEYRYRQIVVNSHDEAEALHGRLRRGEIGFKRAAQRFSLDASARLSGDMGWVTPAAMPPEVLIRLREMGTDEVSEPFETTWGWTLVQFRDRRENESALAMAELREDILRHLAMEKRRRVRRELLDELGRRFPVEYPAGLDELLEKGPSLP